MKIIYLSLFLLISSSFSFSQQVDFSGHLENTSGISVFISFEVFDMNTIVASGDAYTDLYGNYEFALPISFNPNTSGYTMVFIDCDSNFISTSGSLAVSPIQVDTLDYCDSGSQPLGCISGFIIEQEYSIDSLNPNGLPVAVPNSLIVTNTSQGNGLSYFWALGDGSISTGFTVSHSYATAGPFNLCLTVSDSTGCSETFCDSIGVNSLGLILGKQAGFTINITGALNVLDLKDDYMFNIYPNPASENIKMEIGALSERSKLLLLDNAGKLVYSEVIEPSPSNQLITIDLTAISTGIYHVNLFTQHVIVNERLIVR
ncbi:MAG: PKD domain-containing protein [Crocinitomicaceae bacterium]